MSSPPPAVRNRKSAVSTPPPEEVVEEEEEDDTPRFYISFTDVLRVLSGLLLLSCIFSWFITDGASLTFGYRPRISRWRTLKAFFKPELTLNPSELSLYTGLDPQKPIYIALNGSVFDVTASPHLYGPGGSYSHFSGIDAARAYVSGCFSKDLTHDLRGLEEMFITGKSRTEDTAEAQEIRELLRKGENASRIRWLKGRREKRRREAWEKVKRSIDHWDRFYREHERYFYVGKVIHESLEGTPVRELCMEGKQKED